MKTVTKFVDTMPRELQGRGLGAFTIDEMFRLAQVCYDSGMFADVKDAAQALMKIMRGQEMGLPPVTAMSAYDIIRNRLFVKPWVLAAKINSCGYGSYRVLEQTNEQCQIEFRRKFPQVGWQALPVETYTIEDAKVQGLLGRDSNFWKGQPSHMLYQRAMGRGAMRHFPELAAGLAPSTDAMQAMGDPEDVVSDEQAHATIDALYGATARPAPMPPFPAQDLELMPPFMLDVTPYQLPLGGGFDADRQALHTAREQFQDVYQSQHYVPGRCVTWLKALFQVETTADLVTSQWQHALSLLVHEADGGLTEQQRAWLCGE